MKESRHLTSRKAARFLGVGTSSVNRWADAGLLPHSRTPGGHRRFREKDLVRFQRHPAGSSTKGPDQVSWEVDRWWEVLRADDDSGGVLAHLLSERQRRGSWWQVAASITPVLDHIGQSWEAGAISIIEEHVASGRLSRALARCADMIPRSPQAPRCLLATAENDEHTLGLSLVELCLAELGWRAVWCGRKTPVAELVATIDTVSWDMLAISASLFSANSTRLGVMAKRLAAACERNETALIYGGRGSWPRDMKAGHPFNSFEDLHRFLSRPDPLGSASGSTPSAEV